MSQDKTPPAKDAGAEYAEIWGESIHTNRHLRTITVGLGIAVILLIIVVIRDLVAWIIPKDALSSCFSTPGIT